MGLMWLGLRGETAEPDAAGYTLATYLSCFFFVMGIIFLGLGAWSFRAPGHVLKRVFSLCLGIAVIGIALWLYVSYVMFAGFPDSFFTELDQAELPLIMAFNWFSVLIGLWFLYLALLSHSKDVGMRLVWSLGAYAAIALAALALDYYFRLHLMDAAGG
jgi:hypothetical protein